MLGLPNSLTRCQMVSFALATVVNQQSGTECEHVILVFLLAFSDVFPVFSPTAYFFSALRWDWVI